MWTNWTSIIITVFQLEAKSTSYFNKLCITNRQAYLVIPLIPTTSSHKLITPNTCNNKKIPLSNIVEIHRTFK